MQTTVGQLLVNSLLPPDLQDYNRVLDKRGVRSLLKQVAEKYPERYVEISKGLSDVGREIAYYTGGDSVGLTDLEPSESVKELKQRIRQEIEDIENNSPDDKTRQTRVMERMISARDELVNAVLEDAKKRNNPLVRQLAGAGRGNKNTLNSMLGGDVAYVDHKNNPIPLPVLHSYAEGLTPAEYFAGSFGARKGLVDLKAGTAQSGFMAKQLLQVAHRLLTTAHDDDRPFDPDNPRGLPAEIDDPDNEGARLAQAVGGYPRNTVLTPSIISELKRQGVSRLLVRSPTVGGPEDGGVYVNDVGVREKGVPPIGDMVGIAAANALAEPITQMTISSKHCLAKGTLVLMADWSSKPIEDIVPGDMVMRPLRYQHSSSQFSQDVAAVRVVATYNNGVKPCRTHYFVNWPRDASGRSLDKSLWWPIDRSVSNLDIVSLTATDDHKIVTLSERADATVMHIQAPLRDLWQENACGVVRCARYVPKPRARDEDESREAFDNRILLDGRKNTTMRIVFECDEDLVECPTYDIEVDHPDHLFVLANGLIVSNSGGALGAQAGAIEGFKAIEALVNPADEFVGFATHATKDGIIRAIRPAPQGGFEVDIDGETHIIPAGQQPKIEVGQTIEAGDAMSSGLPDPAAIVEAKGVGEGRRYFINTFRDLIQKSGAPVHRRNVELLSRGLINHVRLNDELDEYGPDDVVPYQWLEHRWQPRKDAIDLDPRQATGMYLEKPILHYTIGTPVRPSVVKTLSDYGVKKITAHKQAPPFQAEVLRGMAQASNDPDWMTRMLGSYQQKSLLSGVHRGAVSDMGGSSFVPALAAGVKFDDAPATTGWDPKTLKR